MGTSVRSVVCSALSPIAGSLVGRTRRIGHGAACFGDRAPSRAATLDDLLDLVHGDSEDDHRTGDDLLPERRDADDDQAVGEEADDERTDDGAANGATAPR